MYLSIYVFLNQKKGSEDRDSSKDNIHILLRESTIKTLGYARLLLIKSVANNIPQIAITTTPIITNIVLTTPGTIVDNGSNAAKAKNIIANMTSSSLYIITG